MELKNIKEAYLFEKYNGQITVKGRIQFSICKSTKMCFIILRDGLHTLQVVLNKNNINEELIKLSGRTNLESLIQVTGKLVSPPNKIESCSFHNLELVAFDFTVLNESEIVGLQVNSEVIESNRDTRLNNRVLDLRNIQNQTVFRIKSLICRYSQEFLWKKDFMQIQTPKMISVSSEGGAEVFQLKYFDTNEYLAQSPQLYKQMTINAEFPKVYEIGPVFRAENSNSNRHLTEFTGIDLEMRIDKDYNEVITTLWNILVYIFTSLEFNDKNLFKIINKKSPTFCEDPLIISYPEAIKYLKEYYTELDDLADLNSEQEKKLGEIIKKEYGSDLFVLDKFPLKLRPFYTQPYDDTYSNSYDFILNGMEILSGSQRIHDPILLTERAKICNIDTSKIKHYIDSFKYGSYPYGGGGFGLERITINLLGLDNIREASLYPRDPKRVEP
jgi:aspartyl-tRNA synthetase